MKVFVVINGMEVIYSGSLGFSDQLETVAKCANRMKPQTRLHECLGIEENRTVNIFEKT